MSLLLASLWHQAQVNSLVVAVQDEECALTYADLYVEVKSASYRLQQLEPRAVAIYADNGIPWVLADLAAHVMGVPTVPLPLFFSPAQLAHTVKTAGVDVVITDQAVQVAAALGIENPAIEPFHGVLQCLRLAVHETAHALPVGTQKITFTSGTTGEPKGVCLGRRDMETVAESLRVASEGNDADRHLCLLPLATLLENVGGVFTPLFSGATVCLPRLANVGLSGSSGLDVKRLIHALGEWQATSAIMVPQMLEAVVAAAKLGVPVSHRLRYLAVGGAPVSSRLLEEAEALGLPVHEGYGLSECASVVAVNRPGERRPGSVGKPLPHVRIDFADDGEILIRDRAWLGYLGLDAERQDKDCISTGDLGYLDEDGYLHLTGRKKNIFITSFGRNVAPEWVERELTSHPLILQAAVVGEARPFNAALVVPHPSASKDAVDAALAEANQRLPDYARVKTWIPVAPFSPHNGMATPNGRLRRPQIHAAYAEQLAALYQQ
ncbi:MAG TPA: AMP-binding protein [Rhodocyclaceae bacterium]|nr:AMP-binding protein [Rhodocyclaceae bacterium]